MCGRAVVHRRTARSRGAVSKKAVEVYEEEESEGQGARRAGG